MINQKLLALSLGAILLTACETKVEDGRVPSEFLSTAKQYEGTYTGKMEKTPAQIKVWIDNQDRAHLSYQDNNTGDILGKACGSQIGQLIAIDGSNNQLKRADFAFDPGECSIPGNSVMAWTEGNKITLQILIRYDQRRECTGNPREGSSCSVIYTPVYREGTFRK
jgi:hypothetical protein